MRRALFIGVVALVACDEVGPPPPQPIKPPEGYVPGGAPLAAPGPPGPPEAKPAAIPAKLEPAAAAPIVEPAPSPKCPADIVTILTAKAKGIGKKKKQIELKISAKATELSISFHQPVRVDDATLDEVQLANGELVAELTAPRGKVKLSAPIVCAYEDRQIEATVDPKTFSVTLKQVARPPEPGYLNLVAEPGLKVLTSGKELGTTPLRNVPLPPGTYQLTLKPTKGKPRTASAEIRSGETSNVVVRK